MVVSFLSFYAALVPLNASVPILPRYYLQLVPFALLGTTAMLARRSRRGSIAFLVVLALFFLANRRGHFYPDYASTNFAITERSMAYLDLVELQNLGLQRLVDLSPTEPVFYGLHEHYKLSYPEIGYGFTRPTGGHCMYFEPPFLFARLGSFPDSFAMLVDYPWLGGEVALAVAGQAASDPAREVVTTGLQAGRFESALIQVRRVASMDHTR
jgi:hypothetical protein